MIVITMNKSLSKKKRREWAFKEIQQCLTTKSTFTSKHLKTINMHNHVEILPLLLIYMKSKKLQEF